MTRRTFPPYELTDRHAIEGARDKTRKLERLYQLTLEHAWDGPRVLASLVDRHGPPGADMDAETRASLLRVLTMLLWGELAAWTISADLALEIDDVDAKMAATAQVFDEARHFTVLRDYVMLLADSHGDALPPLGGLARKLLLDVMETPSLAKKLIGMQLLFETNAVVIFRRIAESRVCPILSELLPYFERDESRHVGLGVLYLPRLIERMSKTEALGTVAFHTQAILMLAAGGFVFHADIERLGLDHRRLAERCTAMQDDVVRQIVAAHGPGMTRALLNPTNSNMSGVMIDFMYPREGREHRPHWQRAVLAGIHQAVAVYDRAFA